jgi:hypothetical protein
LILRPATIVWFLLVVAVGYAMFQVKYEVMQQEATLASLNKQIADGRDQIRVLDAEWNYLTQPNRLDRLSTRFLSLGPISSAQITDIASIPERAGAPAALVANAAPASVPAAQVAAAPAATLSARTLP